MSGRYARWLLIKIGINTNASDDIRLEETSMFSALILAATLGAFPDDDVPSRPKPDLAAYKEATAKAARTPTPMSGWLSGARRTA